MYAAGVDLKGRGLPAPIFENVSDPEAADRVATGRKSQAGELTKATNQLLLQSTEDARYDPPPVKRKLNEPYANYYNESDNTLKYMSLALLLVGAFVIIKT